MQKIQLPQSSQLPQLAEDKVFMPDSYSSNKVIESINSYIDTLKRDSVSIDISFLNAIDSSYVSTMCSTNFFIKFPQGKICWKVSSELVKTFNKNFDLGNTEYLTV